MSSIVGGVGGAILGASLVGGGLGIVGAGMQAGAAKDAAQTQAQASVYASNLQNDQFQQQQKNIQPWLQAGQAALPTLQNMANTPVNFSQQDFQNNMDPAYQFDLQQGQQAIQRSAAANGTLMTGGTLKDLTSYSQGQASNEYSNAYNRFMNNQNTQFNRLSSIAGTGQTATGQLGQVGMNTANAIGGYMTGAANAQGASTIAQGNAWSGALSGLGNNIGNGVTVGSLLNRGSFGGGGGAGGTAMGSYFGGANPYAGGGLPGPSLSNMTNGYAVSPDTALMG